MKKLTFESFLNQRKPWSHILYLLIAAVALIVVSIWNGNALPASKKLMFLLLGLIQLEVFIYIARQIFKIFISDKTQSVEDINFRHNSLCPHDNLFERNSCTIRNAGCKTDECPVRRQTLICSQLPDSLL